MECCGIGYSNEVIDNNCLISINSSIITEYNDYGCEAGLVGGSKVGNLNVSGYASSDIYTGCPGRAGAQVLWLRKYSCDDDLTYLIYTGPGRSYLQDSIESYADISISGESNTILRSAHAGSAGNSFDTNQSEGIGLIYTGGPFSIDTTTKEGSMISNFIDISYGDCCLQSFTLDCSPGSIPVASYSFLFTISDNE